MDELATKLINLPWQIQLALGSGYASYLLSYTGIREHHKTADKTFLTLSFGLIATGTLAVLNSHLGFVLSGSIAFLLSCGSGIFWRKYGRVLFSSIIRRGDLSWSNDDPSALASLLDDTRNNVSQIAVLTKDGDWLRCDDTDLFASSPFGPCKIGPNGDVALYMTHLQKKGEVEKKLNSTRDADFGDRMTYIPCDSIQRINFRFKAVPSHRLKAGGFWGLLEAFLRWWEPRHQIEQAPSVESKRPASE